MALKRFVLAAAFLAAAPLLAESHVTTAVQPGGDIPAHFRPAVPPIPKGGDIPQRFAAPRADFQYVRREVMIPMRDGVKLYAVLIIPALTGQVPDHARPNALFGGQSDLARQLRPASREHPLAAFRRAGPRRLYRRLRGRPRKVQVRGRLCDEPAAARAAQPDRGRPFDRRFRHHRLAGEERAREQRPRRNDRHQLRRLHHADEPRQPAPGAQGRGARSTPWSTCGRATTGSTTAPSGRR